MIFSKPSCRISTQYLALTSICLSLYTLGGSVVQAAEINAAIAQGAQQASDEKRGPEEIVIYGHDGLYPVHEQSGHRVLITKEDLEVLQKDSVVDVLRTIPGVLVSQEGGLGGVSSISIRGAEPNFTVVMLDGVPLNDPTNTRGGSFDFSNLNLHSIERIEIIRGSQSAFYGSDALSGVINIITTSPSDRVSQRVYLQAGENGYFSSGYQTHGSFSDKVGYALNIGRQVSGEQIEGSRYNGIELTTKIVAKPIDNLQLDAGLRYIDSEKTSFPEQSGGPELAVSRLLDENSGVDASLYVSANYQISENWQSRLRADWFERESTLNSPGISPFNQVPPNSADSTYRRYGLSWVNTVQIGELFDLTLGAEHKRETGVSEGFVDFGVLIPTNFELERDQTGGFFGFKYRFANRLDIQASVRLDDHSDEETEVTRKLGLEYALYDDSLTLFATWGEGYKQASFFALGHPLVGNPDLQPEQAESLDFGVQWLVSEQLMLGGHYFDNTFFDLIDFDPELFRNVNRAEVSTEGVEFDIDWMASDRLAFSGQATYVAIDTGSSDTRLNGRPEWNISLLTQYRYNESWSFGLNYLWNKGAYSTSLYTGTSILEQLNNFSRMDLNLRWVPREKLHVTVALDNLFDDRNEQSIGFPSPGRWLRFGVEYQL